MGTSALLSEELIMIFSRPSSEKCKLKKKKPSEVTVLLLCVYVYICFDMVCLRMPFAHTQFSKVLVRPLSDPFLGAGAGGGQWKLTF